ncbi:class I SAM-dependent methyltransferase [Aerococcaceae bacterium NML190073]|nr:class I SAM-dependent methyltransferase [Aerococcaceae bacterium NML190073]
MNATILSPRLNRVAELVLEHAIRPIRMADIGSDHAYLPCFLAKNHAQHFATFIAGEVVEGPYQAAKKEVLENALTNVIQVRKGNGLAVIQQDDAINTITICGMGGTLIQTILDEGKEKLTTDICLILQPNIGEATLRHWVNQHQFEIIQEEVIEDNQRLYSIMVAKFNATLKPLSDKECFIGAYHLAHPTPTFKAKLERERAGLSDILTNLQKAQQPPVAKIAEVEQKLQWIQQALKEGGTE